MSRDLLMLNRIPLSNDPAFLSEGYNTIIAEYHPNTRNIKPPLYTFPSPLHFCTLGVQVELIVYALVENVALPLTASVPA